MGDTKPRPEGSKNLIKGWDEKKHRNRKPKQRLPDREPVPHTTEQRQADQTLKPYQVGHKLDTWIDKAVKQGLPKSCAKVLRYLREVSGKNAGKDTYLQSWHSQQTMADELNVSLHTLRWAVRELRRVGMVATEHVRNTDGTYKYIRYTLCPGELAPVVIIPGRPVIRIPDDHKTPSGNNTRYSCTSTSGNNTRKITSTSDNNTRKITPKVKGSNKKEYIYMPLELSNGAGYERAIEQANSIKETLQAGGYELSTDLYSKAISPNYAYHVHHLLRRLGKGVEERVLVEQLTSRIQQVDDEDTTLTGVYAYCMEFFVLYGITDKAAKVAVANKPYRCRYKLIELAAEKTHKELQYQGRAIADLLIALDS